MNVYNNLQNYLSKKYSKQKEKRDFNLIQVSQQFFRPCPQYLSLVDILMKNMFNVLFNLSVLDELSSVVV